MGKMWAAAVACAAAMALMAMLGSGEEEIHFNKTHQNCENETFTITDHCMDLHSDAAWGTFFDWIFGDVTDAELEERLCMMQKAAIECVDTGLCHCNYSADHLHLAHGYFYVTYNTYYHNYESNCGNITYGESIGSDEFGPIDETAGINCTQYNKTVDDVALALAFANEPGVIAMAETCEPMRDCYRQYDDEATVALYNQNLHTACLATEKLVECVINASCECGQNDNETFIEWVHAEKSFFRTACDIVLEFERFDMFGITCPGVGQCNSSDPEFECLLQWYAAYNDAGWDWELICQAEKDWAVCIDTLACECGFAQDHAYHRTLAISKQVYEDDECVPLTGPFPNHAGINCTGPGLTDADKLLTLSLAQIGFVSTEEARCSGVLQCYNESIDDLDDAYNSKNLTAICILDAERFSCLESRYCKCGLLWEPDVLAKLNAQEDEFHNWCTYYYVKAKIPHLICPNCDSPDEHNTCEDQENEMSWAWYLDEYCPAVLNLANCTETVACECGFYNDSTYYHSLTVAKFNYNDNSCPAYIGEEFPSHHGLICATGPGGEPPEVLVSIALADTDYVKAEDDVCPGIRKCYQDSDTKLIEAYHIKDLTAVCRAQEERILCVEQKYCQCGKMGDQETMEKIIMARDTHYYLCYYVTGLMSVKPCRNQSMCSVADPLPVCDMEFDMEYDAAKTAKGACQAINNYTLCMEYVGCMCGLLANGSSDSAMWIHNFTMFVIKVYHEVSCHDAVPAIQPKKDGIQCEGQPDDDTLRRLVLSYADSSEVAAMVTKCYRVHKCFLDDDHHRAKAISDRDYIQYCWVQSNLTQCLDEAYCRCGMNGTMETEDYMTMQINIHKEYCSEHDAEIERKKCVSLAAELGSQCNDFEDCTEGVHDRLANAFTSKDFDKFCKEKTKLIKCVDDAFCKCELNGTDNAMAYRKSQVSYHKAYCLPAIGSPKSCEKATEGAGNLHMSLLLLLLLLLAGVTGKSWALGML